MISSCPEVTLTNFPQPLLLISSLFFNVPEPWGDRDNIDVSFGAKTSIDIMSTLWPTVNSCLNLYSLNKETLLRSLGTSLIYGCTDNNLEGAIEQNRCIRFTPQSSRLGMIYRLRHWFPRVKLNLNTTRAVGHHCNLHATIVPMGMSSWPVHYYCL